MVTDKGMLIQAALSGRLAQSDNIPVVGVPSGEDPATFLKALLQQLQVEPRESPGGVTISEEFLEPEMNGSLLEAGGNLLPVEDPLNVTHRRDEDTDGSAMAPERVPPMAVPLVQQPMQPVVDGLPGTPRSESPPAADVVTLQDAAAVVSASGVEEFDLSVPVGATAMKLTDTALPSHRFADLDRSPMAAGADHDKGVTSPALHSTSADESGVGTRESDFLGALEQAETGASLVVNTAEDPASGVNSGSEVAPTHQPQANAPSTKPQLPSLARPLGQPGWSDDLGERIIWMTGQGLNSAELKLNPAHLGPLEVRIHLNQDQAHIQFVSHNAAVREAIESAIPKLREMLGAQQLHLTDVSVSQHSFAGQSDGRNAQFAFHQQSQPGREGVAGRPSETASAYPESESAERQTGRGLVNLYA